MIRRIIRDCAFAVALILISVLSLQAQSKRVSEPAASDGRVVGLLAQLADQARLSDDLSFAVQAQSQAATLLWPYDREKARAIFRRAFHSLAPASSLKPNDPDTASHAAAASSSVTAAERRQLQVYLLNRIAARDSELAEDLARLLVPSEEGPATTPTREEIERRELLISLALQVVEREPHRAMTLGQLSLALGISPEFSRLLLLMRAVDRPMADLLFSSAIARLQKAQTVELADLHALGSYLVSSENPAGGGSISSPMIVKFLNLAYNRIMYRAVAPAETLGSSPDRSAQMEESAAVYFIGRQLTDLFARHLPERLPHLQQRISELSGAGSYDAEVDLSLAQSALPSDTAREARLATDDEERDALFARAALGWLSRGEILEAQSAASKISDAAMRDRVLAQIARRQTSEGRLDDAVAVAQNIENDTARVGVLVKLAGAALASGDRPRATELLNEADREALRTDPQLARAKALLTIAASFSSFDVLRSFEVMQSAVKMINGINPNQKASQDGEPHANPSLDELYHLDFESTLSALARADFDRALLLAQQLTVKEASLIAQLAVCRGAINNATSDAQSAIEGGTGVRN